VTEDPFDLAFQEALRLSSIDRRLAAEAFQRAIELHPKDPEVRLALARLLTEMREYQLAETAVSEARKLRPAFAEASAVEGRIFREEGDHERAIAAFERALREANGIQPEAAAGLGLLYTDLAEAAAAELDTEAEERYKKLAIQRLNQAKDQLYGAEDAMIIYQLLGRALEKQGRIKEAIAVYERFLKIFPDVPDATAVRSFIDQLNIQLKESQ
jgi:tetratricopeptide (TPR) repeat protein